MKKFIISALIMISVVNLFAQSSKEKVIQATNTEKLKEMSDEFRKEAIIKKDEAIEKAKEKGWVIREVLKDGSIIELQALDQNGGPIYYKTNNVDAPKTADTNKPYIDY